MSDTDVFGVFSSSFPSCGVTYALNPLKLGTLNRIRDQRRLAPGISSRHDPSSLSMRSTVISDLHLENPEHAWPRSVVLRDISSDGAHGLSFALERRHETPMTGGLPTVNCFFLYEKNTHRFPCRSELRSLAGPSHRLISVELSKQFLPPVLVIKGLLLLLFKPAGRAESGLSLICRQEGSAPSAEVVQDFRSEPHFISFRASLKALNTSLMYRF